MQIVIYNPEGEEIFSPYVDDNSSLERKIGNYGVLTLSIVSGERFEMPVGSYVKYDGVRYTLYEEKGCSMKTESGSRWLYDITLCDEFRLLTHVFMRSMSEEHSVSEYKTPTEFTCYGNVGEHVKTVVDAMNYRYSGWAVGSVKEVDYRDFIDYANVKCFDALGSIAEKFGVDLSFEFGRDGEKVINMGKESSKVISLSYGASGGILPGYVQDNSQTNPDIRRLIVLTGDKGLDLKNPLTEGWNQWKLTPGATHQIGDNVYRVSDDGLSVTRDGANELGVEETVDLKEVAPELHSNITGVEKVKICSFKEVSHIHEKFYQQLNDFIYTNKDVARKLVYISFLDGKMAGKKCEFEYSTDEKITIQPFISNDEIYPNSSVYLENGDKFEIITSDNALFKAVIGYPERPQGSYAEFDWKITDLESIGGEYTFQDSAIGAEIGGIAEAITESIANNNEKPIISFESGKLKGQDFHFNFAVSKGVGGISTFYLKSKLGDNKQIIPNETFYPQVDDKYLINRISIPDNFVREMPTKLLKRAAEYYDERVGMNRSYDIEIDEIFAKNNIDRFSNLQVGDYCKINDGNYSYQLKILSINNVVNNPYNYALRLGSTKKRKRRMMVVNPGLSDYRLNGVASQLTNDIANVNFQGQTTANDNYQDLLNRHNRLTYVSSITSKSIESLQMATTTIDQRIAGDLEPLVWKTVVPTADANQEFEITQNSTITDRRSTSTTVYDWTIDLSKAKVGTKVKLKINRGSVNIQRNIKLRMSEGEAVVPFITLSANGTFNGVEITLTEDRTADDLILAYMKDGKVIDLTSTTAITNPTTGLTALDSRLTETAVVAEQAQTTADGVHTNFNSLATWVKQPAKPVYTAAEVGVSEWARATRKPVYTANEVGAVFEPGVNLLLPPGAYNNDPYRSYYFNIDSGMNTTTNFINDLDVGTFIHIKNVSTNNSSFRQISICGLPLILNLPQIQGYIRLYCNNYTSYQYPYDEVRITKVRNVGIVSMDNYEVACYKNGIAIDLRSTVIIDHSSTGLSATRSLATTAKNVADSVNTAINNPKTGLTATYDLANSAVSAASAATLEAVNTLNVFNRSKDIQFNTVNVTTSNMRNMMDNTKYMCQTTTNINMYYQSGLGGYKGLSDKSFLLFYASNGTCSYNVYNRALQIYNAMISPNQLLFSCTLTTPHNAGLITSSTYTKVLITSRNGKLEIYGAFNFSAESNSCDYGEDNMTLLKVI